jgi:hypothetical protein
LTAAAAWAQEPSAVPCAPPGPCLSLDALTHWSWPALEQLYRHADAGSIPVGYTPGRALYCPDDRFAGVRSKVTHALWHGKVFDPCDGTLINQWAGAKAIKARVGYGPSLLDGRPSIIMDYSETSHVWADVRDEVREVAPGVYLGRMYRLKGGCYKFQYYFALEACRHP